MTKIWLFFNFFVIFHNIHIINAKIDHHTKFWQNILGIEEIKFSLYIHSKLGSLCRFFKFSHFLVAFSLKVHGQVDFLLSTQIKPGSGPGEVCALEEPALLSYSYLILCNLWFNYNLLAVYLAWKGIIYKKMVGKSVTTGYNKCWGDSRYI